MDNSHPQEGHTRERHFVLHTSVPSLSFAEMKRGKIVWMLYVPTPKSLWCTSDYDHLSYLTYTFLATDLSPIQAGQTGILNECGLAKAWRLQVLFGPLILGMLFHQQSYMGSLQPKAWVNSRILLDHLWFPALSSVSSLRGKKDLLGDPRIIGNQALHWDLKCCLAPHPMSDRLPGQYSFPPSIHPASCPHR